MNIDIHKETLYLIDAWCRGAYAEEYPNEISALRQAIEQAKNPSYISDDYAYQMIDHFIRNNLDDDDYAEYIKALDSLCVPSTEKQNEI